ncbi:uncharacterized protein LOC126767484 [Bactrocera neohumeralis]|uniref:uncharacterized protein LOC126767484 n=1 Tax=Bactrocera neohumeralis TaxID=98809 RepID=UPI0021665F26|nr:uncharacterized protein LOC126767484 [Bactrocera neohumeralis]XP_050340936.1 uncharacterized protein LOC126767484 [Bactrocera neohumeralis]
MLQSVIFCKGFFYLAAFSVLTHFLIEPVIGVVNEKEEQFSNGGVYKNDFEPLILHKRPSFFVGSRYGRSSGGAALSSSKTRRLSVVPRNDRFFLGSRYGKRSEENSAAEFYSPYEQENQLANNNALNSINGLALQHTTVSKYPYGENNNLLEKQQQEQIQTPSMMSCVYTGLRNFFRCRNIDEINNIINQLTIAHSVEEKK